MKKVLLAGAISASLVITSVIPAFADSTPAAQTSTASQQVIKIDQPAKPSNRGMNLGKEFKEAVEKALVANIDVRLVESLKAQGFTYGEIALIVGLNQKTGKTIEVIAAAVKAKTNLASALGVDQKIIDEVKKSIKEKRGELRKQYIEKAKQEHAKLLQQFKKLKKDSSVVGKEKKELKKEIKKVEKFETKQNKSKGHKNGLKKNK